ncbi:hypothetical protein FCT18_14555 [Lysinibacillus sphaericus]|uniref:DNA-binding protein n=1 Tax=Lysinibacillus sphaericus TaxID=1421 RepID=A0A2S0K685_LYSSH|nr:hypothetical protein [Lysinibacillus sphaericus]AVK98883.1 hypothetical protein LS41612_22615 [Lysinibacillus sphaericus]MED4545254.1 hypothetical protein [Lysinibacillus sphaericus]TKI18316.1 hypothetical protein FCT18_14555 [Lysinibacillus sphaericus]SUV15098.1 Uncharacterised protein [Lysinibacillus sphaericus]GEC82241.1 hypothetical protein LSP03_19840 [Lysinibacillus sphaericus]
MFDPNFITNIFEKIRLIIREEMEQVLKNISINKYPHMLKQEHLCEIFQCERNAIYKLTKIDTFPKFEHIHGRYPRDLVFKWIEQNTNQVQSIKKLKAS